MEYIYDSQISWLSFLRIVMWLLAMYIVFKVLHRWLSLDRFGKTVLGTRLGNLTRSFVEKFLLFYEPMVILIVTISLFLVNPIVHGLVIFIVVVAGFPGLKHYINGRILRLGTSLGQATRIQTDSVKGVITEWDRLGLYLSTDEGLRHIPYSHLVENSFTLISGERMGHAIDLHLTEKEGADASFEKLQGIMAMCPYLDVSQKPILQEMPDQVKATVVLKDELYLPDLIQVLSEWGWDSKLST